MTTTATISATPMASRDDTSVRGHLLGCAHTVADAAKMMGCSESTIRRKLKGLSGWVALTTQGSKPTCCINVD